MFSRWSRYIPNRLIIGLLVLAGPGGCGITSPVPAARTALFASECGDFDLAKSAPVADVVVLDWTGGVSPIYPDTTLIAVDLDLFETADGGTLATAEDSFREDVRAKITQIYCQSSPTPVRVVQGEDDAFGWDVTVLHLTQELPPRGGSDVGEGEYDPCNVQHDNAAILFGERLLSLGDAYTYEEWVNVFANICAHEIGHTIGYGHIPRDERPDTGRSLYVELMLSGHTMAELRRSQRFVAADHTNCPLDSREKVRSVDAVAVTCSTE